MPIIKLYNVFVNLKTCMADIKLSNEKKKRMLWKIIKQYYLRLGSDSKSQKYAYKGKLNIFSSQNEEFQVANK